MLATSAQPTTASDRLPAIILGELLGQGAHSAVHRGTIDGQTVAVKLALEPARAGDERLAVRFRREAAALGCLAGQGVPRAYESGVTSDGRSYVVLEYIEGVPLRARASARALSEQEALQIARGLCVTLARVHAHGFVHRDIKPHNVIITPAGEPVLVDFGLVIECGAHAGQSEQGSQAVGTFAYSAPEQTGMLARALDGRADLYALGAMLFEALMGKTPFEADDAGELLHMHATKLAPRLDEARFSHGAAELVARLLAKDPDDRFADADSVVHAISALLGEEDGVGTRRASQTATAPGARAQELARLVSVLDTARRGRIQLCLVSGATGMGKSWLADELADVAQRNGLTVLRAPCREQGDAPFGPFQRMFEAYVGRGLTSARAQEFRARVKAAAGDFAPYLAQLAPCLKPCFDLSTEELALNGTQELLQQAIVDFIVALGPEPWLVIFEDTEWSDGASLDVLERLMQHGEGRALAILCTLDSEHATGAKRIRRGPGRFAAERLLLAPLSESEVVNLLRRELGPDPIEPSLPVMLRNISAGSPSAAIAYLRAMIDGGVVRPFWGRWGFDATLLGRLALPANVADLALARLSRLSEATRDQLRCAAVLDEPFSSAALLELAESHAADAVRDAIAEAIAGDVLLPEGADSYRFAHAAMRARLGSELGEKRAALHRKLAHGIEQRVDADGAERLYRLAYHHFHGACVETATVAYRANLVAAQRALALFAFEPAITFFGQAKSVAEAHGLPLCWRLCRGLAEARIESGDIHGGLDLLDLAATRCDEPIEQAEIQVYAGNIRFFQTGSTLALEEHIGRAFAALGKSMPRDGVGLALRTLGWVLVLAFYELTGFRRDSTERARDAHVHAALYQFTSLLGMFRDSPVLMLYAVCAGLVTGVRLGNSRLLVHVTGAASAVAAAVPALRRLAPRQIKRAYGIADALHDRPARAVVQTYEAIGHCFADRPVEGEQAMVECLRTQSSWLETNALVTVAGTLVLHRMQRGYTDAAIDVAKRHIFLEQRHGRARGSDTMGIAWTLTAEAVRGENAQTPALLQRLLEGLDDPTREPMRWLSSYATLATTLWERNEWGESLRHAADMAERSPLRPAFAPWMNAEPFVRIAEARYALLLTAIRDGSASIERDRAAFAHSLSRAVSAAKQHPIPVALCGALSAAQRRLDKDFDGALRELGRCEELAHRIDVPFAIFNVRMERARVLSELDQASAAEREAEAARSLAESMRWAGRTAMATKLLRNLRRQGHDAATRGATNGTLATQVTSGSAETSNLVRDRAALLEVSLALAEEMQPGAQAVVALDILLRLLSAERAFIFEYRGEEEGLAFIAARDAEGANLEADTPIARSLLVRSCTRREPLVMSGTEEGAALGSESVVAQSLRSIICAPLILRDQLVGAVYLDSRLAKGMFTPHHLDILVAIANHIAVSQHMARAAQRETERRVLDKDLQLAAAVQGLILPRENELSLGEYSVASQYTPAAHIGGDFWHLDTRDGVTHLLIADVTGHGAGSAMVAACVAGLCRAYLSSGRGFNQGLIPSLHQDLAEICRGQYGMTLSVLALNAGGSVRWVNAGGPPLLIRRASGAVELVSVAGTPLGGDALSLGERHFTLEPGDGVLLFSDGVYEMSMHDQRELGMSRLRRIAARAQANTASELRDQVQGAVLRLQGDVSLDDDQTLVVCMRKS